MSRQCNLSAKELGLECPWVNNDHFPALVSGAEFAPEWACVLVAITFKVTEPEEQRICIRFYGKLIIRLCKLLGLLWRLQLWATGDWQLHHNNVTPHASRLLQSFLTKHLITQVTKPPRALIWCPATCGFFWNWNVLKWNRFQTLKEIQENMTGQMTAIGRPVWGPKVPALKETELLCPCYGPMILFLKKIYLLIMLQLSHFSPSLHSILPTPCLPHSPPVVHVRGPYL